MARTSTIYNGRQSLRRELEVTPQAALESLMFYFTSTKHQVSTLLTGCHNKVALHDKASMRIEPYRRNENTIMATTRVEDNTGCDPERVKATGM